MRSISTILFLVAAIIKLVPVVGAFSTAGLEAAYGITLDDPNLRILMHHRALLFAVVGGVLVGAACYWPLRPVGIAVGLFSFLSFIGIAWTIGDYNAEISRVLRADYVGLVVLVVAAVVSHLHTVRATR